MTLTPILTPREEQLVRAVARGLTNDEISRELNLSKQTVKNQLSTIYQKLKVRNRLQLAMHAYKRGWTWPDGERPKPPKPEA